jgi:UDP-3-O-[3-hydroxymyristoyl] glucosamine N-acyltransferase
LSTKASLIADFLQATLVGADIEISNPTSLTENTPDGAVTYSNGSQPIPELYGISGRCLILIPQNKTGKTPEPYIEVANPRLAFARVLQEFFAVDAVTGIHQTANIEKGAIVGSRLLLGAFSYVGSLVTLGDDVCLGPHSVVVGPTTIGDGTTIRGHTVVGEPGFGFERDENGIPVRIPHIGGVTIGQYCEIGALNTVAAGTLEPTVLRDHVKTDDHVHIAHNCVVGNRVMIAAAAELSGSVKVGDDAWIGPNVSIINGVQIGNEAFIGIGAVVTKDVPPGVTMGGIRARPIPGGKST